MEALAFQKAVLEFEFIDYDLRGYAKRFVEFLNNQEPEERTDLRVDNVNAADFAQMKATSRTKTAFFQSAVEGGRCRTWLARLRQSFGRLRSSDEL